MKGHLRERSPGHWAIVIDVRDPKTGARKRRWHSFAGTKREAEIKRAELIAAVARGGYVEPSKTTVAGGRALISGRPPEISRLGRRSAIDNWSKTKSCRTLVLRRYRSSDRSTSRGGTQRCGTAVGCAIKAALPPAPLVMRTGC
jgi:hypothetical protein